MEIEHLREFLVFSRSLNYTTAAKALYIAQPTLSQHIAKLSTDLGMQLVSQSGKTHLTPAGEILCSYAQSIVGDYDDLLETFEGMRVRQGRIIRIVDIRQSVSFAPDVNAVVKSFGQNAPIIDYVDDKDLFQLSEFQVLDDGLADISFTFAPDDSMDGFVGDGFDAYAFMPLEPERCVVVLASDHPLAVCESLSLSDLSNMRIATVKTPFWLRGEEASLEVLRRRGYAFASTQGSAKSKFILPANDFKYMAITYADVVRMNPIAYENGFVTLPLSDFDFAIQPYAIYRKDNPNAILGEFMEHWGRGVAKG